LAGVVKAVSKSSDIDYEGYWKTIHGELVGRYPVLLKANPNIVPTIEPSSDYDSWVPESGNIIALLPGMDAPTILRPIHSSFQFVGLAYVFGAMNASVWE